MGTDLQFRDIHPADAGEVLTLQRAAFVQEALIYGTPDMPPLTQSLDELRGELEQNDEERGRSLGADAAELFTGSLSEANLRLYAREGYVEALRVRGEDGIEQVFLRKQLRGGDA